MSAGVGNTIHNVLNRLDAVKQTGVGYVARCPGHNDTNPSLSISLGDDGRILLHCFAGCKPEAIVQALGITMCELFPQGRQRNPTARAGARRGGASNPSESRATVQQPLIGECSCPTDSQPDAPPLASGCTLESYAELKRLPIDFIRDLGLSQITYNKQPSVRIPYYNAVRAETAVRFRVALNKGDSSDNRFAWKRGSKSQLYGLWRLAEDARRRGYVTIVEGESDTHTLWFYGEPALGIPGAANWKEIWSALLTDIPVIYIVIEQDKGGAAVLKWLAGSAIKNRVKLVTLPRAYKDPSALHCGCPQEFLTAWRKCLTAARPWKEIEDEETSAARTAAWATCRDLARRSDLLAALDESLVESGFAGDTACARIVYLAVTSRLLPRPVSVVVKGPSSSGKSYAVEQVLIRFPDEAKYVLSAMSEKALAYSEEPLAHRMLVVYEAAGLAGEFATYLMRSLLSEGHVRYETVEKTAEGMRARLIEREGPTGLIMTTTAISLHPENETRMLSVTVSDTREQTRAILRAQARGAAGERVSTEMLRSRDEELVVWRSLQTWHALAPSVSVVIPYAETLVDNIPPVAVRLRRDFPAILSLIMAHALLHRETRQTDSTTGAVVATLDDYAAVRRLVAPLYTELIGLAVPAEVRETVEALRDIHTNRNRLPSGSIGASVTELAAKLCIDKSSVSRRWKKAAAAGYVVNMESVRGKPAMLVIGEPMPGDGELLPSPEVVRDTLALTLDGKAAKCCTVAGKSEG